MMIYITTTLARSAKNLHVEYHRSNYGKFSLKGTKIWIDLPDDVKNSNFVFCIQKKNGNDFVQYVKEQLDCLNY